MNEIYLDLERDARQYASALETDFKRLAIPWLDPGFEPRFTLLKQAILEMCKTPAPKDRYPRQAFKANNNLERLFMHNGDRAIIEAEITNLQRALHAI